MGAENNNILHPCYRTSEETHYRCPVRFSALKQPHDPETQNHVKLKGNEQNSGQLSYKLMEYLINDEK